MTNPVLRIIGFAILCSCIIILTACGGGSSEDDDLNISPVSGQQTIQGLSNNQSHSGLSSIQPVNCSNGACK